MPRPPNFIRRNCEVKSLASLFEGGGTEGAGGSVLPLEAASKGFFRTPGGAFASRRVGGGGPRLRGSEGVYGWIS